MNLYQLAYEDPAGDGLIDFYVAARSVPEAIVFCNREQNARRDEYAVRWPMDKEPTWITFLTDDPLLPSTASK